MIINFNLIEKQIEESVYLFKKITSGLTNSIWFLNENFILKYFNNQSQNRKLNELNILKKISYFDVKSNEKDSYIIMNRIEGVGGNVLKSISNSYFWQDTVRNWLNKKPDHYKKLYDTITNQMIDNNMILNKFGDTKNSHDICNTIIHTDIHSDNIIVNNNKCFIIDWEYAGMGHPSIDLGNIICELYTNYNTQEYNYDKITDSDITMILGLYNNPAITKKQIKVAIKTSHFYWMIWGLNMMKNGIKDNNFDYEKFYTARYKELMINI